MTTQIGGGAGQALFDSLKAAKSTTLKKESYELSGDPDRDEAQSASYSKAACGRANLRAAGWSEADFSKPVITVGIPYSNGLPCNNRMRELGDIVCAAIEREGGKSIIAGTPVISDGETNGSTGMKYSLPSRETIADCMDMMHHGRPGIGGPAVTLSSNPAHRSIIAIGNCCKSPSASAAGWMTDSCTDVQATWPMRSSRWVAATRRSPLR